MSGYTKLFHSIVGSTIWAEPPDVCKVWITMLASADQWGEVAMSVPGLAHVARVEPATAERALAIFLAPDPHSRSKEHEGRRIAVIDGGWKLLNHAKYREKQSADERRAKDAERKRASRSAGRLSAESPQTSENVQPCPPTSAMSAIRSDQKQKQNKPDHGEKRTAPRERAARGSRIPDGFEPTAATVADLERSGIHDPLSCLPSFRDYWLARAGALGAKLDWDATFRVWVRRDKAPRANGRIVQQAPAGGPKYSIGYLNLDGDET